MREAQATQNGTWSSSETAGISEEGAKRAADERNRSKTRASGQHEMLGEPYLSEERVPFFSAPRLGFCRLESEKGSEGIWHPKQRDGGPGSFPGAGIPREPLFVRETVMRPLRTREDGRRWVGRRLEGLWKRHVHALVAYELHAGASMRSATPISPEHSSGANQEPREDETDEGSGFFVCLPCHWHCLRKGQARQSRILAA